MAINQLFLILVSGLGVLHGFLLGIFLWFYKKGNVISNRILGCLLLVLTYRIGKSVILEFAVNTNFKLIFTGLGTLLVVGPLFYFYTLSILQSNFQFGLKRVLHFIPALAAVGLGFWINREIVFATPIWVFAAMFTLYYSHYLFYLFASWKGIQKSKDIKEHHEAVSWLKILLIGMMINWIVYVLNLLEESVPYILGPILYSIVIYPISFIAIRNRYLGKLTEKKYPTTPASEAQIDEIFQQIIHLITREKKFKSPDLSLSLLSSMLKVTPQKISMAINVKSGSNFNDFINHYRIEETKMFMHDKKHDNHTIASIAYECGFNTLSTFNTAFKKKVGKTPSEYRNLFHNDHLV